MTQRRACGTEPYEACDGPSAPAETDSCSVLDPARPSELRLPPGGASWLFGGTGAYSAISVGFACGRFRTDGSRTTARITPTTSAARGGYLYAQLLPRLCCEREAVAVAIYLITSLRMFMGAVTP